MDQVVYFKQQTQGFDGDLCTVLRSGIILVHVLQPDPRNVANVNSCLACQGSFDVWGSTGGVSHSEDHPGQKPEVSCWGLSLIINMQRIPSEFAKP